MTGEELLKRAGALIGETEMEDYRAIALTHINIMLDDTWKQNNRMRVYAGKEELKTRPQLGGLGEEIPFEEEMVREAMPYGLAALLYFDEEDNSRLSMFKEEYANRLTACDKNVVVMDTAKSRDPDRYPIGW